MKTYLSRSLVLAAGLSLAAVASFTGCASTATSESTGQYVDNSVITTKVKAELIKDETVKARDVKVESYKGVVQLSGFVDTEVQKERAAAIAAGVSGVTAVTNNLIVKPLVQ